MGDGGGAIERMRLEEVDGAVTEFVFSDMEENVPVKECGLCVYSAGWGDGGGGTAADLDRGYCAAG